MSHLRLYILIKPEKNQISLYRWEPERLKDLRAFYMFFFSFYFSTLSYCERLEANPANGKRRNSSACVFTWLHVCVCVCVCVCVVNAFLFSPWPRRQIKVSVVWIFIDWVKSTMRWVGLNRTCTWWTLICLYQNVLQWKTSGRNQFRIMCVCMCVGPQICDEEEWTHVQWRD